VYQWGQERLSAGARRRLAAHAWSGSNYRDPGLLEQVARLAAPGRRLVVDPVLVTRETVLARRQARGVCLMALAAIRVRLDRVEPLLDVGAVTRHASGRHEVVRLVAVAAGRVSPGLGRLGLVALHATVPPAGERARRRLMRSMAPDALVPRVHDDHALLLGVTATAGLLLAHIVLVVTVVACLVMC